MARDLTSYEVAILSQDFRPFEMFLIQNILFNQTMQDKYKKIKFVIMSQDD